MMSETMTNRGRVVGALLLTQAVVAIPVYTEIGMMRSVIAPDFLAKAAADTMQIRVALLLTYLLGAAALAVAIVSLQVFRQRAEQMCLWFLALSIVGLAAQTTESHVVNNMLALSRRFNEPAPQLPTLELLGQLARSQWRSAHFTNLLLGHVKALLFFVLLYRMRVVPRVITGLGIATTMLSTTAAVLPLLGRPFSYAMIAPTGLVQIMLAIWLTIRGFRRGDESTRSP